MNCTVESWVVILLTWVQCSKKSMGNEGPLLAPPEAPFNRPLLPRSDPRPFLPLLRGGLAWFTRAVIG